MTEPQLVVVGGPNGSGKTTLAMEYVARSGYRYLGADAIAACLNPDDPLKVRVAAGKQFIEELEAAIAAGESRVVESTLAGQGLERYLRSARQAGFIIELAFVTLDSPDLCMARIRERVRNGGHHVPDADVRRRFHRAQSRFWHHYRPLADYWQLFSNTGDGFDLVAAGSGDDRVVAEADLLQQFMHSVGDAS